VTVSTPAKGALTGAAMALIWVQWGIGALLFVLFAAALGAFAAVTATGRWNVFDAIRDLQDRP
jgi:hypothetical protein